MSRRLRRRRQSERAGRLRTAVACFGLAAVGCLTASNAQVANAQVANAQVVNASANDPDTSDATRGKEHNEFVFVRDSAGAQDKFNLALKMERLKEWDKSADLYQEVLEKYRDRVIPDGVDRNNVINRYTSVTYGVLRQLSQWPVEGLNVYRSRFEPRAAALVALARGDELRPLYEAYQKYFVTESGKKAAIQLIDANLERGEYAAAAEIGEKLLTSYPSFNLVVERPAVLFRTALAQRLCGDADSVKKSEQLAKELAANHPKEMGVVRGKDVVLADALASELKSVGSGSAGKTTSGPGDSWPTLGGGPSRSVISSAHAVAGTRLYSIALSGPDLSGIPEAQNRQQMLQTYEAASKQGLTISVMPVVDGGELYFHDGTRLTAVNLETGTPLTSWLKTYPASNGQYVLPGTVGSSRQMQQTLTVTDRYVLAVMGQPDQNLMIVGVTPRNDSRLVCLDRQTGKSVWTVSLATLQDLPKDDDGKAIRRMTMSGAPLVVGDSVLTIARSSQNAQSEDCYVLAFDLNRGTFRWSCFVASSGVPALNMYGPPVVPDRTSHLAYANGRVFVMTNLGAVGALDAYSGTIIWLDVYPIDMPITNPRGGMNPFIGGSMRASPAKRKPWQSNPILVSEGKVFALPDEGRYLGVYDATSGKEVKRIALDGLARWPGSAEVSRLSALVGVQGDQLVLASEKRALCINWQAYDEETFPGKNDSMVFWPADVPVRMAGRPFMTADRVFTAADDRLRSVNRADGRTVQQYPDQGRAWEKGEGPGNIIVSGDYVVIAGADRVNVYTDLKLATARLDRTVAAAPREPEPRLRYAEVMFVAGHSEEAMQRLDEAIELLGGLTDQGGGRDRSRLFNDALSFATKLAADPHEPATHVEGFFDRAARAAFDPQQYVHYRVARAKYCESQHRNSDALKLYQEILSSRDARAVPLLEDENASPKQAGDVAESAINELVSAAGADIYAEFSAQASAALDAAKAKGDPSVQAVDLLEVAERYPNASVASSAMMAAADAFEAATKPREAVRVLRQMWFKYGSGAGRAAIAEGMARNYLATDSHHRADSASAAAARLQLAASLPNTPKLTRDLKTPEGEVIAAAGTSISDALDAIRKLSGSEARKSLADFRLPVPEAGKRFPTPFLPEASLPDSRALVLPTRDAARRDRVMTWSPDKLSIFAVGKGLPEKPVSTSAAFAQDPQPPRGVAWSGDLAIVWGGTRAVAIDSTNGATVWSVDAETLPTLQVVRGNPTSVVAAPAPVEDPNPIIQRRFNGNFRAVPQGVGQPRPVDPPEEANEPQTADRVPTVPPLPTNGPGEQIAGVQIIGDRLLLTTATGRLLAADVASGKTAWQIRLAETMPDRVEATEEFTVVRVSDPLSVQLFALDTYSGRLIGNQSFATVSGSVPVNLALSPDGTLVYTMPDRLCLRDLYRSWDEEERSVIAGPPKGTQPGERGPNIFAGATRPGQLVVSEGRILAVAEALTIGGIAPNEKYVRVHSLETGQPLVLKGGTDRQVDQILTAGTKDWNVTMKTVGSKLYVISPRTVYSYDLDRPDETWHAGTGSAGIIMQTATNYRDAFVGSTHLVVLDQVPNPNNAPAQYRLNALARYPSPSSPRESGRLDYSTKVTDPSGIAPQWQACDGGFFFATADGKVKALVGSDQNR